MTRAIVFNGDETWELRDLAVPDPQPGGAVLRVEATGLCHSDIDHFRGHVHTSWGGAFPSIPGHEIVGRIEKIDPAAAEKWGVTEGDRVAVWDIVFTPAGHRIYGHDFSVDEGSGLYGGFAEHLELLPGSMVYKLRDDLPADQLTVFEPLSCAVTWVAPVKHGDVVLIEGPGHMGMATIVAAKAAGAASVIVTGTAKDRFRLDCAHRVGADHTIDVEAEDPVERVREITGGELADVVIDAAAGNPVTVNLAMDLVHRGGHVVIAGMKDRPLEGFHSDWIPTRRITLHPGAGLDAEGAVALINAGKVPTAELLGDSFPLEKFEDAFALLTRQTPGRDSVRVALRMS
ncbi:zinc-binding dehydrogenase [Frankia sp. CNm7]|uniref:Zinc-binding dehydrogenase n=1 Tax=Frankia nepalensis TaxID=1836974 RepID=A0A937UPL6_9ACTN|nr:zinc-binding dehydrogenase [Frankia nepalensis]MBL7502726.1 zinc-binding dehydrogenase [Frankia nepalensis]MBL7515112.1 zinc-binding dehydrogenase [Frankia nepalensis]MBL7521290.1 zinc-binding dehydrogenase [Frankia nepalensis]MBL7629237.1 zinc-binding dehydrogenase [Frankia nepalensis]